MLMKLTAGINFENILQAAFYTEVFSAAFLYLHFSFVIFWWTNIGAKAAHKMLAKLPPGVNFINILRTALTLIDPKSVKRNWKLD